MWMTRSQGQGPKISANFSFITELMLICTYHLRESIYTCNIGIKMIVLGQFTMPESKITGTQSKTHL